LTIDVTIISQSFNPNKPIENPESRIMKKPSRLLFFGRVSGVLLLLIASLLFFTDAKHYFTSLENENEEEENEGKGIPGIMHAMELWGDMRTYPFPDMRSENYSLSVEQARAMDLKNPMISARGNNINIPPPWTPLGPMNFAGRTLCLAFHPTNPNIMFAGSASGGIWKTTVGGSTGSTGVPAGVAWTYVPTGFPVLGVSSIAFNPLNGNEIYAGTGEVYNNAAAASGPIGAGHIRTYRGSYGIGIIKSTDGGVNWTKTLDFSYSNAIGVSDIVVNPVNPLIVYAATTNGLYRTINGGANWQVVLNVPVVIDLAFKPGAPSVLYVACGDLGSTGTGIYKTIDADNTVTPTFTQLAGGLPTGIGGKIQLAVTPLDPNMVLASIGNDPITQAPPEGLYKSADQGATWTGLRTGASSIITNQGWYSHDIAIDPGNINRFYWGELNFYRSTNGGGTFTVQSDWSAWSTSNFAVGAAEGATNYVHADIHRIYSPSANTVYICTDGGVFRSTNMNLATPTFSGINGGMQTTQIYQNMAVSQQNQNIMIGGLQDNEGCRYAGAPNFYKIGGLGDGFHCAIDPLNDNICFTESYYMNIKKSGDKGVSWSSVGGAFPAPVNFRDPGNNNQPTETVCFNTPLVIAPSNTSYVYAASCRFKRSTDAGGTWTNTLGAGYINNASTPGIYMAVAPTNNLIVYLSTGPGGGSRSRLYKTTDGGNSFGEITGTLPDRYYSSIAVDPTDPNRLLVALSGFTPLATESQIYLSHNGGTTWSNLGNNLPDVPINVVRFDPMDRAGVYVGTDAGLFYTNGIPTSGVLGATTTTTWTAYNEGLPDAVMVSDLQFTNTVPKKLRLATYGNGFWERALAPQNLPVVFRDFKVFVNNKGNELKWTVSDQVNVNRYEVEYSTNVTNFKTIGIVNAVPGAGQISYTYLHPIRNDVKGYYRIKTVDMDGELTYSSIEEVKPESMIVKLTATPNPTTGLFKISVPSTIQSAFRMHIYDVSGRLVFERKFNIQSTTRELQMDITRMPAGSYQLVCEDENYKFVTRIIKR